MNTQTAAKWFGIVIFIIGVLGFIPGVVTNAGYLAGIFSVNTIFNLIYIITGMVAYFSADTFKASKIFFKIIGPIFLIIAVFGIIGKGAILGIFPTNIAVTILHIVFAFYALYFGFGGEMTASMQPAQM